METLQNAFSRMFLLANKKVVISLARNGQVTSNDGVSVIHTEKAGKNSKINILDKCLVLAYTVTYIYLKGLKLLRNRLNGKLSKVR